MLKLESIHIKNFTNIKETTLDLTSPVTLFIGENASGKSSVVDAIAICLSEHKRSDTFKDYVQHGQLKATIDLIAYVYNEKITFNVVINSEDNSTALDRKVEYKGKTYINSEVSQLLNDLELTYYSDLLFSMQGENDITKLSPMQRANYLQRLLAYDFSEQLKVIETESQKFVDQATYDNNNIEFKTKSISSRKAEIKSEFRLPFSIDTFNELTEKKLSLEKQQKIYTDSLVQNAKIDKDIAECNILISTSQGSISNANNNINYINERIDKQSSIKKDIDSNQLEIDNETLKLSKLNTELSNNKEDLTNAEQALTQLTSKKIEVNINFNNVDKQLKVAEQGICPTCGNIFTEDCKKKYQDEKEEYSSQLEELEKDIDLNRSTYNSFLQKNQDLLENISNINSTIASCKKMITKLSQSIFTDDQLKKEQETKEQLIASINEQNKNIENLNDKISKLKTSYLQVENISIDEFNDINNKLDIYYKAVTQNELIKSNNENINLFVETTEKEIDALKGDLVELNKKVDLYKNAKQIFSKQLPDYLIIKTCARLQNVMNNFIQIVFPEMEVQLFHNKKGVEFFYTTNKSEIQDNLTKENMLNIKMASGFEKAVLSMAFKVALCKAYNLTFCILDEVDAAASENNSEKMFESIIGGGFFNQCIIISQKPIVRDVIKQLAYDSTAYNVDSGSFTAE